jgi:two-component system OmpR family sensor kinase
MRTLTARFVATSLVLTALAILAFGVATTLALRGYLMDRLDRDVMDSLARAQLHRDVHVGSLGPIGPPPMARGQGIGTLTALIPDDGASAGLLLNADPEGMPEDLRLRRDSLEPLQQIPTDGEPHTVRLQELGDYRAAAMPIDGGRLVTGLPQSRVNEVVGSVVRWEAMLGVLTLAAAGIAGLYIVRRNLAPLRAVAATAHEAAALPLSSGAVDLAPRVPDPDERTEVGQVGAALNTLLAHIENALAARHRSEQQVRQFVADASHELRTPLSTIRGYADLATSREDDVDAMRTALRKVTGEAERMSALVEDLLLLAQLDAGRPLMSEPVDLSRLTVEAVADARVLAPGHTWLLDVADQPVEVVGDERRLQQVVRNLVSNARQHTPEGTTVTVTVEPGRLTVADNGPGFDQPETALERFSRGDPARTGGDESVGLGLSIVDSIVRAHGGSVSIDSRPDETRVIVELPT